MSRSCTRQLPALRNCRHGHFPDETPRVQVLRKTVGYLGQSDGPGRDCYPVRPGSWPAAGGPSTSGRHAAARPSATRLAPIRASRQRRAHRARLQPSGSAAPTRVEGRTPRAAPPPARRVPSSGRRSRSRSRPGSTRRTRSDRHGTSHDRAPAPRCCAATPQAPLGRRRLSPRIHIGLWPRPCCTSPHGEPRDLFAPSRRAVGLRHAYQSAPKNPAMSAANSSGASAAAKWPPRGMGVQRWMS